MRTVNGNKNGGYVGLLSLLVVIAVATIILAVSLRSSFGPAAQETDSGKDAIQAAESAKKLLENPNRF